MRYSLLSAMAVATLASAQTFTTCDPTKKTCAGDVALGKSITVDFTKGASNEFFLAEGTTLSYGADGAAFTIKEDGNAPTITSNWYIFFGKVEVVMRAAPGTGIVSSFVMESDDLDEIDWEWLGGDAAQIQTNYFGKGNTTTYDRGAYHPVAAPQTQYHTYAIDWKSTAVQWIIDGTVVRTLNYADANGGKNFPQTPMQIKMGNWVGGSPNNPKGTVEWAGGLTDFGKAPFTMNVKSLTVTDYSSGGKSYVYSDMSGSWQSIKTSDEAGSIRGATSNSGGSGGNSGASGSSSSGSASGAASSTAASASGSKTTSAAASTTSAPGSGNLGAGAVTADPGTSIAGSTFVVSSTKTTAAPAGSSSSSTRASTSASSTPNAAGRTGTNLALAGAAALGYLIL